MTVSRPVKRVVVVGRDEAFWLTLNVLHCSFGQAGLEIVGVELPSMLRETDVSATLHAQEAFHSLLGLDEAILMEATDGVFSLGQRFSGWSRQDPEFFHGYSTHGIQMSRVDFLHYWVKARVAGLKVPFEDFAINTAAAKAGQFFIPGAATDGFAIANYTYHLGAVAYCEVLRRVARKRNIPTQSARMIDVRRNSETGQMTSVLTADGAEIHGDVFIDTTGSAGELIRHMGGQEARSWGEWFPCNQVLTSEAPALTPLPNFSQISAFRSGWVGLYPLRGTTKVLTCFTDQDMRAEEALEMTTMVTGLPLKGDATLSASDPQARPEPWIGNCIAIGDAAVVFEPLDNVRLHAVLSSLSHLVSLFPIDADHMIESQEYNRIISGVYENIRDFQILHYKLNKRFDQPMWDHARQVPSPDRLAARLELFQARGNLISYDDETFDTDSWRAVMIGHGLIPEAYDPVADQTPEPELVGQFMKMLGYIRELVSKMTTQEDYFKSVARAFVS